MIDPDDPRVQKAADVLHGNGYCRDNQHDGPEEEWECVETAMVIIRRLIRARLI